MYNTLYYTNDNHSLRGGQKDSRGWDGGIGYCYIVIAGLDACI